MKSIFTKYLGPSNVRGSRYKAFDDEKRHSITLSADHSLSSEENHRRVAQALKDKLGWKGTMTCGSTMEGIVCVFDMENIKLNPVKRMYKSLGKFLRYKGFNPKDAPFTPISNEFEKYPIVKAIRQWEKNTGLTYYYPKNNPIKRYGSKSKSKSKFKHKRLVSPKKFAKKSFRVIHRGGKEIVVACAKGKYSKKTKKCKVGMRAQAVLTPKRNPEIHIDVGSHNVNPKRKKFQKTKHFKYIVQTSGISGKSEWRNVGRFESLNDAKAYAYAYANSYNSITRIID